jgi:hypothetical protein
MLRSMRIVFLPLLLSLAGCPTEPPARTPEDFGTAETSASETTTAAPPTPPPASGDAPEISRSRGEKGGVVVFWPRIWPKSDDPAVKDLATKLQQKLKEMAEKAVPGRPIDVRPEPERVCPRDGCAATTVGAVLIHKNKACAAVAVVSGPGTSPGRILPWSGAVKLAQESVPFREPPEEQVTVDDFGSCAKLMEGTAERDAAITQYIKGLTP